jgi:hypothetical protein
MIMDNLVETTMKPIPFFLSLKAVKRLSVSNHLGKLKAESQK